MVPFPVPWRLLIALLAFSSLSGSMDAQASLPSRVLEEGEDLIYNVRYGFIDLGQVRIRTLARNRSDGTYYSKALIQSYDIPLVDLYATFESWIDSTVFSHRFVGRTRDGKNWDFSRYSFDYDLHRVLVEKGRNDSLIDKRDTLSIASHYHDGLSLFYYARDQLLSGKKINIPTLIKEEKVNTFIDFKKERTSVEVDAIDHPVDVIRFEGLAEFVGIFGLTGEFEGWFSNDEARVPIMAKMKVILGSVTIELMKWNRQGWNPPRGTG